MTIKKNIPLGIFYCVLLAAALVAPFVYLILIFFDGGRDQTQERLRQVRVQKGRAILREAEEANILAPIRIEHAKKLREAERKALEDYYRARLSDEAFQSYIERRDF